MQIGGVYATAEDGMNAHPIPKDRRYPSVPSVTDCSTPIGWHRTELDWVNGLDWEDTVRLIPYEVESCPKA